MTDSGRALAARWLVVPLALGLFLGACKDDPTGPPRDMGVDRAAADQTVCNRPPLALCTPPPYGGSCPNTWFCPGCLCTGATKVAACNPLNNDCRYFCTGCYPNEYALCSDPNQSANFLSRCGFCFLRDAGPGACNVIGPFDGGVPDAK